MQESLAAVGDVRVRRHHARVDAALAAHLDRARRGIAHPVEDFLFEYYSERPGRLRQFEPGLPNADVAVLRPRVDGIRWIRDLLAATDRRPPAFGCFGLHEWAMVHRSSRVRHRHLGLRLSDDEVAATVEERGVWCTHFDAYRFFTPTALPHNDRVLTRAGQLTDDQPGCLHTTMDLYKWAGKLRPATPSELIMDCFDLAMDVRWVDMRASPYDLSSLPDPGGPIRTTSPIMIETTPGRAEYVALQREFADRGQPLRRQLLDIADQALAVLDLQVG
ncbi:3-methyladenine DNA glycosylase [Propionibacteriaceae bacterium Y2011]